MTELYCSMEFNFPQTNMRAAQSIGSQDGNVTKQLFFASEYFRTEKPARGWRDNRARQKLLNTEE